MNTNPFHVVVLKRDRLYGDLIGRAVLDVWPEACVQIFRRGLDALREIQQMQASRQKGPDLFVTGVMIEDMDGLEHIEVFGDATFPILIVTAVPYWRMFAMVRSLRFDGIYDAAEGLDNLPAAMRAAVGHQRYLSPGLAELLKPRRHLLLDELTSWGEIILSAMGAGASDKEVAQVLNLSPQTVKTHRKMIMRKLGLHDKGQLFVYACQQGYVYVTPNGVFRPGFQRCFEDLKRKSAELAGACGAACQCVKEAALSYLVNQTTGRA